MATLKRAYRNQVETLQDTIQDTCRIYKEVLQIELYQARAMFRKGGPEPIMEELREHIAEIKDEIALLEPTCEK